MNNKKKINDHLAQFYVMNGLQNMQIMLLANDDYRHTQYAVQNSSEMSYHMGTFPLYLHFGL